MNYPFENLDPERFQQLCQALLTREFPNAQCFPVGQPDGGRDAISFPSSPGGKFIVFQAKFVRNPFKEEDPHASFVETLKPEIAKIAKLLPSGAEAYYVLTNVPGTAHLESGAIDKTQTLLDDLGIPSMCWWRDDLSRRLDGAWDLKWSYPEVMTGTDLIRAIFELGLSEDKERRSDAIRAFVRDQYEVDRTIRFKQVDLHNSLVDLFIDLPAVRARSVEINRRSQFRRRAYHAWGDFNVPDPQFQTSDHDEERRKLGAASVLLDPSKVVLKVVLEGAPGQGKSTIVQYICQIHRMRILDTQEELQKVTENHRHLSVRLPIKADIRDFATWLRKRDPFSADDSPTIPANWNRSLESFIAALIRHHSGGIEFAVADLLAVARVSSMLLVLDGLDEVADISMRREVVEEILKGVNRLEENAAALQVIVTSRPTAFANSPGLPEKSYYHIELDSVMRSQINEYADKWARARNLSEIERKEMRRILKDKLDQPHLRDLARNPMQLAILLSLIHTRGSSLPDQRTALYDAYMELFFNREAEKSEIVRKHRVLLIDIHQFLAWVLHCEAEAGRERGSVTGDQLRALLQNYLSGQDRDTSLVEELFSGMVERVVALVSRVQGTYEFEVQPLREYFTARYLYETAPYSPTGNERRGTKPDRFDAIARNLYWLNVTRFFAGCFSKGELAGLVERLEELAKQAEFRDTSHPRALAAVLLADWVFAQNPKATRKVVSILLDGLGIRFLWTSGNPRSHVPRPFSLPIGCGREELVRYCVSLLDNAPPLIFASELVDIIRANTRPEECEALLLQKIRNSDGVGRTLWFEYGLRLGALTALPITDLEASFAEGIDGEIRMACLFEAGHLEFCESTDERVATCVRAILGGQVSFLPQARSSSPLIVCAAALNVDLLERPFQVGTPGPFRPFLDWLPDTGLGQALSAPTVSRPGSSQLEKCLEFANTVKPVIGLRSEDWLRSLDPWDTIVETSRMLWGESWTNVRIAGLAAGLKSKENLSQFDDLFDTNRSLCRRARYARLRSGAVAWWSKRLRECRTASDVMFVCLVIFTWATPRTIASLIEVLDEMLEKLTPIDWITLFDGLRTNLEVAENRQSPKDIVDIPGKLGDRTATILVMRLGFPLGRTIYKRYLENYRGTDPAISWVCKKTALEIVREQPERWTENLHVVERGYLNGFRTVYGGRFPEFVNLRAIPIEIAKRITNKADKYPTSLVVAAEARCREALTKVILPVGKVAKDEGWFSG